MKPIVQPARSAASIAGTVAQPWVTFKTARIALVKPLTDPTDRSISPRSSTSTMPIEMIPTADICCTRFERLFADRKRLSSSWKTTQMTTSPTTTGIEPSSPDRMRRTKTSQ